MLLVRAQFKKVKSQVTMEYRLKGLKRSMEYHLKGLLFHLNFISIFVNKTLFTFGSMCDGNLVSVCIVEQAFILFQ